MGLTTTIAGVLSKRVSPASSTRSGRSESVSRTPEEELHHFGSLSEFVAYYNGVRLHLSLDIGFFSKFGCCR
ncbi:MAG: hypothetical protein OXI53_06525 [Nitrospira sp.]|nr:hypothetical protein [Nitrososphaerota archaeon]MDE0404949.1 hypothetical protein [Nitrospira sp.]MDE0526827.1 hypothetical protein [Nitrososphaerota archaeon]